jgi:hypothetical protein
MSKNDTTDMTREWKCTDAHPNSPLLGKNYKGFKDLTDTNMCYRCDYCDQPYQNIYWLYQIACQYYICDNCKEYYRLTAHDLLELQYVENRTEWQEADCWPNNGFFPYPIGFDI